MGVEEELQVDDTTFPNPTDTSPPCMSILSRSHSGDDTLQVVMTDPGDEAAGDGCKVTNGIDYLW